MSSVTSGTSRAAERAGQEPFTRVAPILAASLVLGAGGGFFLAATLTVTSAFSGSVGLWWFALAQAHGHLQLYGWAGLFVIGVALHFVPRLMGQRLVGARLIPWVLGAQVIALLVRSVSQPLLGSGSAVPRMGLATSGVLEVLALVTIAGMLLMTARQMPALASRPALWSVLPFVVMGFASLALESIVNLINMLELAGSPGMLVSVQGDALDVTLGLFGFLVPIALAMSARALPMYAGLEAFPRRVLWPLAWFYLAGLILICAGTLAAGDMGDRIQGGGQVLLGATVITFVGMFVRLMSSRGKLPHRVAALSPDPAQLGRQYVSKVANERATYGPYVALIGSAYLWAILGGVLLLLNGIWMAASTAPLVNPDAIRHTFAVGFIALLLCGVSSRMIPGFSGHSITSARLVSTLLWVGNGAATLRVGSLLVAPVLANLGSGAAQWANIAFGLSGPLGLILAVCLAWNLWPALNLAALSPSRTSTPDSVDVPGR